MGQAAKVGNGLSILADVLVGSFNDLGDILRNRRVLPPVQRIFMALTNIEPKVSKDDADKIEPALGKRQRPGGGSGRMTLTPLQNLWSPNKMPGTRRMTGSKQ